MYNKMKRNFMKWSMLAVVSMLLVACSENYSRGEKVGTVIEFAQSGLIWDSWDGRLRRTVYVLTRQRPQRPATPRRPALSGTD